MYKSLQAVEMVQWSVWLLPTRMTLGPKPLLKSVNKDQKRSWFAHLEWYYVISLKTFPPTDISLNGQANDILPIDFLPLLN